MAGFFFFFFFRLTKGKIRGHFDRKIIGKRICDVICGELPRMRIPFLIRHLSIECVTGRGLGTRIKRLPAKPVKSTNAPKSAGDQFLFLSPSPSFLLSPSPVHLFGRVPDFHAPIYPRWRIQRWRPKTIAPKTPALQART